MQKGDFFQLRERSARIRAMLLAYDLSKLSKPKEGFESVIEWLKEIIDEPQVRDDLVRLPDAVGEKKPWIIHPFSVFRRWW